jgi:catechol 2,3-dioxygenase-like lactoylglutathione lyase family enzyme
MAAIDSINHTAICVHDLGEAVRFYCDLLGAVPHSRSNFQIEDARSGVAIFQSVVLEDYMFALTVAPNFMPMPDEGQLRGAHGFRHGLTVSRKRFGEVQDALRENGVRFEGPVEHPAKGPFGESIYFKDPSGNFLEILWRRDEDPNARKRRFTNVE